MNDPELRKQFDSASQKAIDNKLGIWAERPEESDEEPMKPVPGINLAEELEKIQKEEAEKQRGPVQDRIRGIFKNLAEWKPQLSKLKKEAEKLEKRIVRAETALTQLAKGGDEAWKAFQDEQQKQENQPKKDEDED